MNSSAEWTNKQKRKKEVIKWTLIFFFKKSCCNNNNNNNNNYNNKYDNIYQKSRKYKWVEKQLYRYFKRKTKENTLEMTWTVTKRKPDYRNWISFPCPWRSFQMHQLQLVSLSLHVSQPLQLFVRIQVFFYLFGIGWLICLVFNPRESHFLE